MMPLIGGPTAGKQNADRPVRHSIACGLYRDGAYAEAYRILAALYAEERQDVALMFNLALCHVRAERWKEAYDLLEQGLRQLDGPDIGRDAPADAVRARLTELQAGREPYLCPMRPEIPDVAPQYARETITRLLVDVCIPLGLRDRAGALIGGMREKSFDNVQRALAWVKE